MPNPRDKPKTFMAHLAWPVKLEKACLAKPRSSITQRNPVGTSRQHAVEAPRIRDTGKLSSDTFDFEDANPAPPRPVHEPLASPLPSGYDQPRLRVTRIIP